jgi:hypothetical protein
MAAGNSNRPFSRKGLHRLECLCGAYLYSTVANVELRGLPTCACGERFTPARRELAELLGVPCAAIVQFETAKELGLVSQDAAVWVEDRRRRVARERQIAALLATHLRA